MAFLTAAALPRARARAVAAAPRRPAMTVAPVNADQAKPMKEMYAVAPGKKAAVCRCWQSGTFPLCDGTHNKINKETGSHVGPLVVSVAKEE